MPPSHMASILCRRSPLPTLRRRFASTEQLQGPKLENIGILRAYGRPVATIFLWSALTYSSFQAVWNKLYYDELCLETEAKIDQLQAELAQLKSKQSNATGV
ncbi:hypothetical protein GGI07_000543 [Coemansia sp. Benny D115]|nr:hypothetical protein GGI07_000543 [Coemansia sp. Benny D115]